MKTKYNENSNVNEGKRNKKLKLKDRRSISMEGGRLAIKKSGQNAKQ
jgi:hypothetical protein